MTPVRRLFPAVLAAALLTAACGSTARTQGQVPGSSGALDGLGTTTTTGGIPDGGLSSADGGTGAAGPGRGQPGGPAAVPTAGTAAPGAGPSSPGSRGALAPVTLGFQWLDTSSGTGGIDPSGKLDLGNQVQQAKVTVDWLNTRGGIAGHPVKLVTHAIDYLNLFTNGSAEYQAACAAFTEDAKVSVAALYSNDPELVGCLSQRGVTSLSDVYVVPKALYGQRYFSPSSASYERGHAGMIGGLAGRGFFKGGKVGIFYDTTPVYRPVLAEVKKAFAAQGIAVASEFGSSLSTAAAGARDASSAVLQFRSAGVTHVAFIDLGGGLTYLFMNSAQSQAYHPKYALSTANNLTALQLLGQPDQLANAAALGWTPGEATSEGARVRGGWNATGKLCRSIMLKGGVDMSSETAASTAILVCDMILAAAAAGTRSGDVSGDGFLRGAEGLGTTFQSSVAFSTRLAAGRRDGATASRFVKWGRDCVCWLVDGPGPNL